MLIPRGTLNVEFKNFPWPAIVAYLSPAGIGRVAGRALAAAGLAGRVAGLVLFAATAAAGLVLLRLTFKIRLVAAAAGLALAAAGVLAGAASMDIGDGDVKLITTAGAGCGGGCCGGGGVTRSTTAAVIRLPMRPVLRTHLPVAALHTSLGAHGGHAGMISPINSFFLEGAARRPHQKQTDMTTERPSPFAQKLLDLLTASTAVGDFVRLVVTEAVESLLLKIARDHALDYRQLLDRYRTDTVNAHTRIADESNVGACVDTTRAGARCSRRGIFDGRCARHADQHAEQLARARRLEAYRDTVRPTPAQARPMMTVVAFEDDML